MQGKAIHFQKNNKKAAKFGGCTQQPSRLARPKNSAINTAAHRTKSLFYCVAFWPCRNSRRIGKAFFFPFFLFQKCFAERNEARLKNESIMYIPNCRWRTCYYRGNIGEPMWLLWHKHKNTLLFRFLMILSISRSFWCFLFFLFSLLLTHRITHQQIVHRWMIWCRRKQKSLQNQRFAGFWCVLILITAERAGNELLT